MNTVEQKLRERHLDPTKYHVSWDEEVATFSLFNLSGQMVGYQNYRWNSNKKKNNDPRESRYYTWMEKDKLAVWGLETFYYRNDLLFLTEGVFDAVRLHNLGLPAIAVLSNNPKKLRGWLRTLNRHVVAICDGDKAGRQLAKLGDEAVILNDDEDLGDLSEKKVKKVVDKWL